MISAVLSVKHCYYQGGLFAITSELCQKGSADPPKNLRQTYRKPLTAEGLKGGTQLCKDASLDRKKILFGFTFLKKKLRSFIVELLISTDFS